MEPFWKNVGNVYTVLKLAFTMLNALHNTTISDAPLANGKDNSLIQN